MIRGFFILFIGLSLGLPAYAGLGPGLEKQCGEVFLKAGHSPSELQRQCHEKQERELAPNEGEEELKVSADTQHTDETSSEGSDN